jgi:hypothetical protein
MNGHTRPRSTFAVLVSLGVLASLTMSGCTGAASQASSSASTAASASQPQGHPSNGSSTTTSTTSTGTSKSASPSKTGSGDSSLAWVPPGPSDPTDPPPNRWYGPLRAHDCAGLSSALEQEPGGDLWRALDAVCAAVIDGHQSQWAVAEAAGKAAATASSDEASTCLTDAAKAFLARALAWHQEHPGKRPVVRFSQPGQRTACPFRVTSIGLVDNSGNSLPGPLEGPLSGGTLLAVRGQHLTSHPTITVGGYPATISDSTFVDGAIVVVVPPVTHPFVGKIRVTNNAGQVTASQRFTYVAGPSSSTSSAGTASPGAT